MLKIKLLKANFISVNNISFIIIIVDLLVVSDHCSNHTINLFPAVANFVFMESIIFFYHCSVMKPKGKKLSTLDNPLLCELFICFFSFIIQFNSIQFFTSHYIRYLHKCM